MNKETVVIEEHSIIGFGHNTKAEQSPNDHSFPNCYGCNGVRICPSIRIYCKYYYSNEQLPQGALAGTNAYTVSGIRNFFILYNTTVRAGPGSCASLFQTS